MYKPKRAFVDIDGTILAPMFQRDGGDTCICFPEQEWIAFCEARKHLAYEHCVPVQKVIRYAEALRQQHWEVGTLSAALSDGERLAKRYWLECQGLRSIFTSVNFVNSPQEKIAFMQQSARSWSIPENEQKNHFLLVDDDLSLIIAATRAGFAAFHTSHIYAL